MSYSLTKLVGRFYHLVPYTWYEEIILGDSVSEKLRNLGKIIMRDIDGYKIFPAMVVTYDEPDNELYIEFLRENNIKKMIEINVEGAKTFERSCKIDDYKDIVNGVLKHPADNMRIVDLI